MSATWPAGLPQFVLDSNYTENMPDQTLESPVAAGIAKIRRLYTAQNKMLQATIECTNAQMLTYFDPFYNSTLAGGSLPFTWVHPRYQTAVNMRFRKPAPVVTSMGGGWVQVAMTLEILP